MRIVLGEAAHAQEPMQRARALVAVDGAEFCQPQGQVAIRTLARPVDQDVARTVHRFDPVALALHLHRTEHVLAERLQVARDLEDLFVDDVRRVGGQIAALQQFGADELLDDRPDLRALGVPEDQAWAGGFVDREKVQLFAELAVIAALGFRHAGEIRIEFGFVGKRRAIDALQHRVVLVAAPIGAGDREQLDGADFAARVHVAAAAKIRERADGVHRERLVGWNPREDVELERLLTFAVVGFGGGAFDGRTRHLQIGRDEFGHPFFDARQIIRHERRLLEKIVVKPVFDGGSDGQLHVIAIEVDDRVRKQMRGGMPQRCQVYQCVGAHGACVIGV